MQLRTFILNLALFFSLFFLPCLASHAATADIQQQLQRRVTVSWQGQQLGAVLERLSQTQGLAIWLDRRVDPQQTVQASYTDLPLLQLLEQLAEKHSLGISRLGNLVYIGPVQSASEVATLAKLARDSVAQASANRKWLDEKTTAWLRLSQPRDLLTSMLRQVGVSLRGSEMIPHDLWDARELPRLALVDRVVLVLVGFDLTCKISADGGTCQVVPINRPVVLKRQYRITKNRTQLLAELSSLVPDALVETKGRSLTVAARWEDHLLVQQAVSGKQRKATHSTSSPPTKTEQLFTLQLKNQPVGSVINQLAQQLKLQIEWDKKSLDQAGRSQETLVSCDVKDVPLDELLSSVLAPAGLQFRRDGKNIAIKAAP